MGTVKNADSKDEDSAFLTNSQDLLILLIDRPHSEQQGPKTLPFLYGWKEGFRKKEKRITMGTTGWVGLGRLKEECMFLFVFIHILYYSHLTSTTFRVRQVQVQITIYHILTSQSVHPWNGTINPSSSECFYKNYMRSLIMWHTLYIFIKKSPFLLL